MKWTALGEGGQKGDRWARLPSLNMGEAPNRVSESNSFHAVSFSLAVLIQSKCLTLVFWRCDRCALQDAAGTWVRCSAQVLARGEGSMGGLCLSRSRVSSATAALPSPSVLSHLIMFNRSAKVPPFPNPSVTWTATFLPSTRHCTVCMRVESCVFLMKSICILHKWFAFSFARLETTVNLAEQSPTIL